MQGGGYYEVPFYVDRGMAQGDPLSSTIINVVVDAVFGHWESLVVGVIVGGGGSADNEAGQTMEGRTIQGMNDGRRQEEEVNTSLKVQAAFLNADDRMVAYKEPDGSRPRSAR